MTTPSKPDLVALADESEAMLNGFHGLVGSHRETVKKIVATLRHLASPSSYEAGQDSFQSRVKPWTLECFNAEIAADKVERNHRFLEEALELVQACGCTQSEAHQLVDYVFGRDQGDINQEVGGVMVTLAALCLANGFDMHSAGETELARIWTKIEKIRAKQAAKPKHSPLPGPSEATPSTAGSVREILIAALEAHTRQGRSSSETADLVIAALPFSQLRAGSVREALDLLQLQQIGRAHALRLLDQARQKSDPITLAQADAYEECGNELRAALALSAPVEAPVAVKPLEFFNKNVDRWGATEWFDRLAKAVHGQDAAVLAGDDITIETCRNVAASSAMRLVREFEKEVRSALTATTRPLPSVDDVKHAADSITAMVVSLRAAGEELTNISDRVSSAIQSIAGGQK